MIEVKVTDVEHRQQLYFLEDKILMTILLGLELSQNLGMAQVGQKDLIQMLVEHMLEDVVFKQQL